MGPGWWGGAKIQPSLPEAYWLITELEIKIFVQKAKASIFLLLLRFGLQQSFHYSKSSFKKLGIIDI